MPPRIGLIPENEFAEAVKKLKADVEALKGRQYSGADSNRMHRIFTADAYDIEFTNVGFNDKAFDLIFTPDDTTFDAGLAYKMEYTYTESASGNSTAIYVERRKVNEAGQQIWRFALSASDFFPNALVRIKFYIWAGGPGSFTTQVL